MSDCSSGHAKPTGALPEAQQFAFGGWARRTKTDPWRLICLGNDEHTVRARLCATHLNWLHAVVKRGTLPPGGRIFTPSARADGGEDDVR